MNNSLQQAGVWIKASERLPDRKMYYNCSFEGMPVAYWIDKENECIVTPTYGDVIDKSLWDKIFWLEEKEAILLTKEECQEITEALEQCISRINPKSKDTWDLKALFVAQKILIKLK